MLPIFVEFVPEIDGPAVGLGAGSVRSSQFCSSRQRAGREMVAVPAYKPERLYWGQYNSYSKINVSRIFWLPMGKKKNL